MTQKKLRLVRAKLFSACPVRRGAWYLEEGCLGLRAPAQGWRAGRFCERRPRPGLRGKFEHTRR